MEQPTLIRTHLSSKGHTITSGPGGGWGTGTAKTKTCLGEVQGVEKMFIFHVQLSATGSVT